MVYRMWRYPRSSKLPLFLVVPCSPSDKAPGPSGGGSGGILEGEECCPTRESYTRDDDDDDDGLFGFS